MATGGSAAASLTSQSKNEALTCALCLDIYRQPKLLPCSHTFCLKCLKDLVDQASSKDASRDGAQPLKTHENVPAVEAEDVQTNSELTDSGVKEEEISTALTTSGYTSQSCEDEVASEVFSADGVSHVDTQGSEAVDISETVPENIQKSTKFFLCPSCREQIKVPEGGASGFQNNVYIREDELERAREETQGLTHSCKTYDLFCVECDVLICVNCKLSEHLHHKSQTLAEAAANAKTTISQNKARLKSAREGLEKNSKERETDRQQFSDKKDLLEKEIRQRRSKIVAAADKYCDEALRTLENTFTTTTTKDLKALVDVNKNITQIRGLEERMQNAETSNDQCDLVLVAKELRSGNGSRQVVDKLASLPRLSEISRPVLRSSAERDDVGKMFTTMEKFIGKAEYVKMETAEPEVSAEMIQCEDVTPNAELFCICLNKSGLSLYLSFTPSCECEGPLKVLSNTGNTIIRDKYDGKVESYATRRDKNRFIYEGNSKDCITCLYAKSHTKQIFQLKKSGGAFSIKTCTVVSDEPFNTKTNTVFKVISCGNLQAFDMNDQEKLAAVIFEDSQTKARQVKLFRRRDREVETAVATYTPPRATSVLADVCFFTLEGQEVLLIADKANDAIHVVEVKDDKMTFSRFLCPGCPLLLQPTALNTDHKGRLWVGCRGGRLVIFEPLSH